MTTILQQINSLDQTVFLFFNGFHNSFFDTLMWQISNRWVWVPMYIAIVVANALHFKSDWRKLIGVISVFLIAFALTDYLCVQLVRPWIARPRPAQDDSVICHLVHIINDYRGGHYGTPSSHATNTYMLAMLTMLFFRRRKLTLFMFAWATLLSYSRIYLGVHYPGDILLGGVLGISVVFVCYKIYRWMMREDGCRSCPYLQLIEYTGLLILLALVVSAFVTPYLGCLFAAL